MTDAKNDRALFDRISASRRAERADKLAQAKREATQRGKQAFDLDKLEQLYDTGTPGGFKSPREERERDYEYRYYVYCSETMNLAEYAAKQTANDAGADPRPLDAGGSALMSRVAGVDVAGADAVEELVTRQLVRGGVWSDRADYNEVDGLRRAMRDAGPLLSSFGNTLLKLLEHDDERVRTGAIAALGDAAGHVSAEDVARVAESSPQLFRAVTPTAGLPVQGPDLEAALAAVVARLVQPGDARATDFLRDYLARSKSVVVLLGLADAAPDWVVANAATAVPRSAIGGVLRKLPDRHQRRALLQALAPWPADEGREAVAKSFWKSLAISNDERDELEAIVHPTK